VTIVHIFAAGFPIGVSAAFFFLGICQQSKTEHGSGHEMKNAFLYHREVREGILIPIKK
jgi:hypothetical protein